MQSESHQDIVNTIGHKFGLAMAMAIDAAIKVAAKRWQPEDTVQYGIQSQNLIQEED